MFLIEGARLCEDAALSGVEILRVFYTEKAQGKYGEYLSAIKKETKGHYLLDEHVFSLISSTKTTQGIACVCEIPKIIWDNSGKILILENVQDPNNMGTILRTAEAMSLSAVILCGNCCDPFSPKVLRGTMGAVFRLPVIFYENIQSAVCFLKKFQYKIFASVVSDAVEYITNISFPENSAVIIGNEGNGISDIAKESCDMQFTIPMKGRAESLNASVASSIIMWEMTKN